jgi:hypothetical protein
LLRSMPEMSKSSCGGMGGKVPAKQAVAGRASRAQEEPGIRRPGHRMEGAGL